MDSFDLNQDLSNLVASAADISLKPWMHSVVDQSNSSEKNNHPDKVLDVSFRIECRSKEGVRYPINDLELEVFRSGNDLNLILSWCNKEDASILWQGRNSVWMDPVSGQRCQVPIEDSNLERLARRLRSLFISSEPQ